MAELSPIQKELLDRADTIFKTIAEAASKAASFAAEQLPDIAIQYIAMERVYLTSIIVGSILAFFLALYLAYWTFHKFPKSADGTQPLMIFPKQIF